ncbi:MAG TPA: phosphatase PAP2 family protein [Alphaproteobacteria bacterium]|nr:phosphatase PAP2 family protein [Alphaproteobacteria bacterium]
MKQRVTRILAAASRLGLLEIRTLLIVLLLAGAAWSFAEIAEEVGEGETRSFDEAVLLALREPGDTADPIGPRWFEEAARDVTALGGVTVLAIVTLSSLAYMLMADRPRMALLLAASVIGAQVLSSALKHGFARPRPELVAHEAYVYTASFPSGHSVMAAATYLTLGAMLAQVQTRRRQKAFLLGIAVILVVLVGLSRVYLGVHWPTDVLAGWTVGAGWAALVWLIARVLQRSGLLRHASGETEIPPPEESSSRSDAG